jgi:hypothetical protein
MAAGPAIRGPVRQLGAFLVWVIASGCGGRTLAGGEGDGGTSGSTTHMHSTQGDDASGDDPSGDDGGSPDFFLCPLSVPALGSECSTVNQGCTYMETADCARFVCDRTGHWQSAGNGC